VTHRGVKKRPKKKAVAECPSKKQVGHQEEGDGSKIPKKKGACLGVSNHQEPFVEPEGQGGQKPGRGAWKAMKLGDIHVSST